MVKSFLFLAIMLCFLSNKSSAQSNKTTGFLSSFTARDSAFVSIFADGNIQGQINSSVNSSGPIGIGAIGISVVKKKVIWLASINIASTTDTLDSGFSTIILTPASGKGLSSGLLEFQLREFFKICDKPIGFHGYASASSSRWLIQDTLKGATAVGLGALLVNDIIESTTGQNSVYLGFEFGPTYRGIFGDVSNSSNLLEQALGTKGNQFVGLEGGLKIKFNKITAGFQGFWLWDVQGKQNVDGITSLQLTGGITISGAIFQEKFKLKN